MKKRAVLWLIVVCMVINQGSAILTLRQSRTPPGGATSITTVVGIATVELGGLSTSQPTYYFDCITNLNNGSGIRWDRTNGLNRFRIIDIPDGSPGKRLDTSDINYPDLDTYICSDRYSTDVASVNINASNPAIMPAEGTVGVLQGLTVELEVYVSGYPTPTSSHITWYHPDRSEISDDDSGAVFQDGRRRLILSNVQPHQAGVYECEVVVSLSPYMGAVTSILLEVYVPSVITAHPQAIVNATEWSEVVLTCSASGTPTPTIRWEREGEAQLPVGAVPSPPGSMSGNTATSLLTFEMVRYEHRGRYRCVADNRETTIVVSKYADIRITPALRLEDNMKQPISDLYPVENEISVRLECRGTGTLQWSSSTTGLQIPSDSSSNVHQAYYDHTRDALALVIQNFTSITTATYTCMTNLTDAHNSPITTSILITSSNPDVIIQSEIQYVLADSSTTLEARVFASPPESAVVQWYHRGRLINNATESSYTITLAGDLYRLTVNGVSENEVGEYTIVVTLDGRNATDRITLSLPDRPSATVTPLQATVSEGEEVRFTCNAQGSGPLVVTWTKSDGSPLPVGVQENGNSISIVSAISSHPGTYVCTVSNLAGTVKANATLTVYYSPTAVISYDRTVSTPGTQPLYLIFDHGASGPTITCSANGNPPPTVKWVRDNGRGLPSGIRQQDAPSSNGEVAKQLSWQRNMEFTDSGSYVCRAFNSNGTDNATLELLVQIQPIINSISPSNPIIQQDSQQIFTFAVPIDHVGSVLTCTANGWPAPVVEWHKNNAPVPSNNGIVSESIITSATVSARLMWMRGFAETDADSYQCVVYKQNTDIPVVSQTVQLNARLPTTISPTSQTCSVQQTSIHFQIRAFATNCESWGEAERAEIASEFRNELLSVIRAECSCTFEESSLQELESAQCSSKVNRAVVFHGQIETLSQRETELIFCSLHSWQQKSPLIRIDGQLRAIDTNCSLEASGSPDSEECAPPTDSTPVLGLIEIVAIGGGAAVFLLLLVIILLICCLAYCRYRRGRKGKFDTKDDHTYTRTDSFSRYSRDGVGMLTRNGGMVRGGVEPTYSALSPETMDHQSSQSYPEQITLHQILSTSSENLINSDGIDGGVRVPSSSRTRTQQTEPAAYQIPINSRENLTLVGRMDNSGRVQAGSSNKRHVSSTSSYDSTSHLLNRMQNPRPSNASIEDNVNDYEDISGDDGSVCDSPTPASGRAHGRPSVGSNAHMYHQLTETRKQSDAPAPPASFFISESSRSLRGTMSGSAIGNSFTHTSGSQIMPSSSGGAGSRPQRSSETTRIPQLQQTSNRIGDGNNHTTAGSTASCLNNRKQELMAQFQSADDDVATHPRVDPESSNDYSKLQVPPYTSSSGRPSSDAILHTTDSSGRDSPMIDNAAYGGVNREQQHPWYYESDVSLNSSTPQTVPANAKSNITKRDQIEPYAVIHSEHVSHLSRKVNGTKFNFNNNSSAQFRSNSRQRSEVQPFAESGMLSATTEV